MVGSALLLSGAACSDASPTYVVPNPGPTLEAARTCRRRSSSCREASEATPFRERRLARGCRKSTSRISPLLANIYLNPLDHLRAEKGFEMVRYADDFVILCRTAETAREALQIVREWTQGMGLTLHPDKTHLAHAISEGSMTLRHARHTSPTMTLLMERPARQYFNCVRGASAPPAAICRESM